MWVPLSFLHVFAIDSINDMVLFAEAFSMCSLPQVGHVLLEVPPKVSHSVDENPSRQQNSQNLCDWLMMADVPAAVNVGANAKHIKQHCGYHKSTNKQTHTHIIIHHINKYKNKSNTSLKCRVVLRCSSLAMMVEWPLQVQHLHLLPTLPGV